MPSGQVGVHVLEGEEVELLDLRPAVALEVIPARDRSPVLLGPGPLLRRAGSRVRDLEVAFGKVQRLLVADEVVAHAQPELDEGVQVGGLCRPVRLAPAHLVARARGALRRPCPAQEALGDGLHHHVVDEVLHQGRSRGHAPHHDVEEARRVGSRMCEGKRAGHVSNPGRRTSASPRSRGSRRGTSCGSRGPGSWARCSRRGNAPGRSRGSTPCGTPR